MFKVEVGRIGQSKGREKMLEKQDRSETSWQFIYKACIKQWNVKNHGRSLGFFSKGSDFPFRTLANVKGE